MGYGNCPFLPMGDVMGASDESSRSSGTPIPADPGMGDFRDLVERLPLMAYIDGADPASPSLWVSPYSTAMLGYTPEEWGSRPDFFLNVLHPDDRERVVAETAHTIATGDALETEYRLLGRDGSVIWVRDEGVLVRDADGAPLCLQGYVLDISERKQREAELLASEALVESSFDAIVSRTTDGIVTGWNRAAERLFGYGAAEMVGRSVDLLLPGESSLLAEIDARMREGEVVEPLEAVCVRKDGAQIEVESTVSPLFGTAGEIIGSSSITRDITERKHAQALAAGQAELLELVAGGAEPSRVLDQVARFVEAHGEGVLASILLLDRDGAHLLHGAAPSLPEAYTSFIDGSRIGPAAGSCGTAAYRREAVCVTDIEHDPLWVDYRGPALAAGLRACWSTPIFATDGRLLGTFALYYRHARERGERDIELVELATHVAGIAIERARAEEAAAEIEERYRDLFENANEPIATVTMDECITDVNRAFERVLGYTRGELIGTSLSTYMTADARRTSLDATQRKLSGEAAGTTFEQEFIAKSGDSVILEVSSRVIEEHGRAVGVQGICRDVTARKQAEGELRRLSDLNRHQALHDDLTGLPNRAYFGQGVDRAISRADGDGTQIAVLLMDLDRFKEINDTLGHRYGDLLLMEVARRLESVIRGCDTVARLGGDEFGILVCRLGESQAELESVLQRILAALDQPFPVDGLPLHVEASIGVARYPVHGGDVDSLLKRADVAMYVAKESGLTHAVYAAELDHHDTASLTLLSELPRALRERELVLRYQPKLDVRSGELAGIEALTTWQHPTRGLIMPGEFVPAAEKTGLIQPFTRYVLDEALGQVTRWERDGHRVDIAVNLSMRNLLDTALPGDVEHLLAKWQLPGERLTVEITESAIVSDPARTTEVIRRLKRLGVGIGIDDFGTGYTSLAYLARLAITQLKIDRSFVLNMSSDPDDAAIVRSIITLGHDLNLEVVAEGVETRAIYDELARLGCDTIQGYWLSYPLAPDALAEWLTRAAAGRGEAAA
jgi:diguanylate cyclase (GGDEF)-like protein/PAS domain S-box-containing protein